MFFVAVQDQWQWDLVHKSNNQFEDDYMLFWHKRVENIFFFGFLLKIRHHSDVGVRYFQNQIEKVSLIGAFNRSFKWLA